MKTIFFILFVFSLFLFSYEYVLENNHDCNITYQVDIGFCDYAAKMALAFNETNFVIDSILQKCKKKAQEKLELCLKNITNTN